MKKRYLALAVLILALAVCGGCSGRKKTEETEAPTTAAQTTEAEETEEDEEEPDYDSLNGTVTAISGDTIKVLSFDDENEYEFDISGAELIHQYPLTEGDEVYVEFIEGTRSPLTSTIFEVEEAFLAQSMDPFIEGTVTGSSKDIVTVKTEDGGEYPFIISNAYIVTKDGIKPDVHVEITYYGEIDDDAYAVRVVTEDSFGTPEAEKYGFVGSVAEVEDDRIVLISEDEDFFTFVSDDLDFEDYEEDDTVQIIYEGKITDKEIRALEISRK